MRKLFLIANFSAISAPARRGGPVLRLSNHDSPIASFLFDTNKAHRIIIPMRAPLKTKEKQFSIRYKFAARNSGSVSQLAATKDVRNFRCHSNVACLGVPVVLT